MNELKDNEPQIINATMLRTKTRDILETARFGGGHFIVETFGKPMVAIVGVDEYWQLVALARKQGMASSEQ